MHSSRTRTGGTICPFSTVPVCADFLGRNVPCANGRRYFPGVFRRINRYCSLFLGDAVLCSALFPRRILSLWKIKRFILRKLEIQKHVLFETYDRSPSRQKDRKTERQKPDETTQSSRPIHLNMYPNMDAKIKPMESLVAKSLMEDAPTVLSGKGSSGLEPAPTIALTPADIVAGWTASIPPVAAIAIVNVVNSSIYGNTLTASSVGSPVSNLGMWNSTLQPPIVFPDSAKVSAVWSERNRARPGYIVSVAAAVMTDFATGPRWVWTEMLSIEQLTAQARKDLRLIDSAGFALDGLRVTDIRKVYFDHHHSIRRLTLELEATLYPQAWRYVQGRNGPREEKFLNMDIFEINSSPPMPAGEVKCRVGIVFGIWYMQGDVERDMEGLLSSLEGL